MQLIVQLLAALYVLSEASSIEGESVIGAACSATWRSILPSNEESSFDMMQMWCSVLVPFPKVLILHDVYIHLRGRCPARHR